MSSPWGNLAEQEEEGSVSIDQKKELELESFDKEKYTWVYLEWKVNLSGLTWTKMGWVRVRLMRKPLMTFRCIPTGRILPEKWIASSSPL